MELWELSKTTSTLLALEQEEMYSKHLKRNALAFAVALTVPMLTLSVVFALSSNHLVHLVTLPIVAVLWLFYAEQHKELKHMQQSIKLEREGILNGLRGDGKVTAGVQAVPSDE